MKIVSLLLFCFIFSLTAFAQISETTGADASDEVKVEEIYLAKDNGEGKAGDEATVFTTTDIPIYCVVMLNSLKPATVKMSFVAVKVVGVKPETKVVSFSFKTNGKQNRVNFSGSPEGDWIAGSYRVDIFVDGKPAGSRELQIQKSATENPSVKSFQPKLTPKPKTAPRRTRKN